MTKGECIVMLHCPNPWHHPDNNMMNALAQYNGGIMDGLAGQGLAQAGGSMSAAGINVPYWPAPPTAKAKRCIERLREEIKEWHGNVLKS